MQSRPPVRILAVFLVLAAIAFVFSQPREAKAQSPFYKTYQVQVEYWFFDTDYYYWATIDETASLNEASFLYELLLIAKENKQLNEVVPNSYGRYIAMDVRIVTKYHYLQIARPRYSNVIDSGGAQLRLK